MNIENQLRNRASMIKPYAVLGLMSGTSLDGIDLARLVTDGETIFERGASLTLPYDREFRARVKAVIAQLETIEKPQQQSAIVFLEQLRQLPWLCEVERLLTLRHVAAIEEYQRQFPQETFDTIGFHGQTVLHRPARGTAHGVTLQIGDGEFLAKASGKTVVYDFRSMDVAAHGEGAPLVPAYHRALILSARPPLALPQVIVNIGGVANLTWIEAHDAMIAFDTGPGVALIDDWILNKAGLAYDQDGAIAARGTVHQDTVQAMANHPYFQLAPPKSLDRNQFKSYLYEYLPADLSLEDGAATLVAISAMTIACGLRHLPSLPDSLWICGGGRLNQTLMRAIDTYSGLRAVSVDQLGWNGDSLEAEAFAFLAARCMRGLPISYPMTTGVMEPLSGGRVARFAG